MKMELQEIVLSNLVEGKAVKAAKKDLATGTHSFRKRLVVDIDATVDKGEDYETSPTSKIPMLPILALLVNKTRTQFGDLERWLQEHFERYLAEGDKVGDKLAEDVENLEAMIGRIQRSIIKTLPKTTCSGKTSVKFVKLTIEEDVIPPPPDDG
jgi:hypothetical protein